MMQNVLDFYKSLPFNYYESAQAHAERIRNCNAVLSQQVLDAILNSRMNVLDVGSGAGWLANNIAYHYKCAVTGIDFNPVAITRAKEVASHLGLTTVFKIADLFTYVDDAQYDLVASIGVLHHTNDCLKGLRRLSRCLVRPRGYLYGGLYHLYGRKPFLDYFDELKKRGFAEEELLGEFKILHSSLKDETHLKSWFRDQVLHPHETQHTLKEVVLALQEEGFDLISTSINKFETFTSVESLFDLERGFEKIAQMRLRERKYFPGFFTFLAKKR